MIGHVDDGLFVRGYIIINLDFIFFGKCINNLCLKVSGKAQIHIGFVDCECNACFSDFCGPYSLLQRAESCGMKIVSSVVVYLEFVLGSVNLKTCIRSSVGNGSYDGSEALVVRKIILYVFIPEDYVSDFSVLARKKKIRDNTSEIDNGKLGSVFVFHGIFK